MITLAVNFCILFKIGEWILNPGTPRTDFISANREGLFSVHGYVALHLAGVSFGSQLFSATNTFGEAVKQTKKLGK